MKVVIIEATHDHTEKVEEFILETPQGATEDELVNLAIDAAKKRNFSVIRNDQGGQNEVCTVTGGEDYIAITVYE